MEKDILNFYAQFSYIPEIINKEKLRLYKRAVIAGMGGSHLSGDILKDVDPFLPLSVHSEYGLPALTPAELEETLIIASSYSGNTEETLDAAKIALENNHNLLCIGAGGKLIAFAKEKALPYIEIPNTGIQPRLAIGFSSLALAKALGREDIIIELNSLKNLSIEGLQESGKEIAETIKGKIPVINTSARYRSVAYNWKIKFNETGKIPAFYNVFPELNHNEMQGFGGDKTGRENFAFIFIASPDDHPRVLKRFEITEKLYQEQGYPVIKLWLREEKRSEKIFKSLTLADFASFYTAQLTGVPDAQVPMVESFKKQLG